MRWLIGDGGLRRFALWLGAITVGGAKLGIRHLSTLAMNSARPAK